jgi:hypothetical protein
VRARRVVLVLVLLGACDGGLSGGSGASGGSGCGGDSSGSTSAAAYTGCDYGPIQLNSSGCGVGPGFAAGGGGFVYVCPAVPDGGTWFVAGEAGGDALLPSETDPYCAFLAQDPPLASALDAIYGLPTVAVGESFLLDYETDAGGPSIIIAPATPSEIQTSDGGVAITQPGYLAFVAWQGAAVAAFTNVLARNATALALATSFPIPVDGGAVPSPIALDGGALTSLVAFPTADDGTMLAGASPACTFVSSAPQIVSVRARGVVALLTPLADGEATLSARCGALSGTVTLQVSGAAPGDDAEDDAGMDGGPDAAVDGTTDGAVDGTTDVAIDGTTDGAVDGAIDALDEGGQP